jgi:isopenicillin N synthase-like dioxygenase
MLNLPIIDITPLKDGDLTQRRRVAGALGAACRETGFFGVAGHGVSAEFRARLFAATRSFFARSREEKDRLSIRLSPHNRGYVGLEEETLDPAAAPDRKEAFNIGLELAPDSLEIRQGRPLRGVNFWPHDPHWRDLMLDYFAACKAIGGLLHRAFSLDLGLEDEAFFDALIARPAATLRLLHYPGPQVGWPATTGQPGAGEHTDYGNITLLITDGVAGLQVRQRDGRWVDVADTGDLMLCNIGDCLMRWTNDIYISTPHRVQAPPGERYSIAFFLDADPDAVVDPRVLDPGRAPLYPPITAGDYLLGRFAATYEHLKPDRPGSA